MMVYQREDTAARLEDVQFAAASAVLGGLLFAFSAMTWTYAQDQPYTLWGTMETGWLSVATAALLLGVAGAAITYTVGPHLGPRQHGWFVVAALVLAVAVIAVGSGWPDEHTTAPARWLSLLATLTLAALHGDRIDRLRGRRVA